MFELIERMYECEWMVTSDEERMVGVPCTYADDITSERPTESNTRRDKLPSSAKGNDNPSTAG